MLGYVASAREEGARLLAGGGRPEALPDGNYLRGDRLRRRRRRTMRVFQEEIFGPVLVATPFADEAEAVELANATQYGLAGLRLDATTSARAHRVAQRDRLRHGAGSTRTTSATCGRRSAASSAAASAARAASYSFEFYCELETIQVALAEHRVPRLGLGE